MFLLTKQPLGLEAGWYFVKRASRYRLAAGQVVEQGQVMPGAGVRASEIGLGTISWRSADGRSGIKRWGAIAMRVSASATRDPGAGARSLANTSMESAMNNGSPNIALS
jgi:hypothetical protein